MATWKKVIVSGSTAELANLKNAGIAEHAAVIGGGSANDQTGVALTNGQLLIGADGAAPTAASLTTATATESGSLKIDAGANSLKLRVAGDTITALSLSGSVADAPTEGQTVKVGPNGTFTFDDASSVLSAGLGITIANNQISSSIANTEHSYGSLATTTFTGSFSGSLDGTATNATNVTTATDDTDTEAFITFGNASATTQQLKTNASITADLTKGILTATGLTGSLKGNVVGDSTGAHNGTVGATSAASGKFTTLEATVDVTLCNAASDKVTIAGDLIVQGNTTEVQTTNLNIEDQFILLQSGSDTSAAGQSGIIFGGLSAAPTVDSANSGQGSSLFVDKTLQRLSVSSGYVNAGDTSATVGAHIPLVTTGSLTAITQVGNFKVDGNGDLFVYAG